MRDFVEPLEGRRLLAGDFAVKVNFQPGRVEIPDGYLADAGQTFGARRAGHLFGWDADNTAGARDRDHPRAQDQRWDTLNHLNPGNDWELAVPNGAYEVRLIAGDPDYFNSVFKIAVENVLVIDSTPTSRHRFAGGVAVVSVSDGRLSIAAAPGAENNKLTFVDIRQVDPPASAAPAPGGLNASTKSSTKIELNWNDIAGETGYRIERKRGTSPFKPIAIVAANDTNYVDEALKSGTKYTYRVRSFNATGGAVSGSDAARTLQTIGTTIEWTTVAPSPIKRGEAGAEQIGDKLYLFGGYIGNEGPVNDSHVYDTATDTWHEIADLPTRVTHAGTATDGRYIYVAGGYVGTGPVLGQQDYATVDVWRYDTVTDDWSAYEDLPAPRGAGALVRVGRALHFMGGVDPSRADQDEHWSLDLDNPGAGWQSRVAIPDPLNHVGAVEYNGKIYVVGGQVGIDDAVGNRANLYVWDPASPSAWTTLASMPTPRSHINEAVFTTGNHIIVAGGITTGGGGVRDVTAYNPETNTWTPLTPLPAARFSGAGFAYDGFLYFLTGSTATTAWRGVFTA